MTRPVELLPASPRPRRTTTRWAALLLLMLGQPAARAASPPPATVVDFNPQGTVKHVRQVTARFSEPIVPLGDPRGAAAPFDIECTPAGTSRWLDSRTWTYEFGRDLPAGVRCAFRVRTGLTTLAGRAVAGPPSFAFSTGGPAVMEANPFDGDEAIAEDQAFVLVLDGEATEESVLANVAFRVEGLPQPVAVRAVSGDERAAILGTLGKDFLSGPAVVLQARQRFPSAAAVQLVWGRGVATPGGVATEAEQVLSFQTRPAFTVRMQCERERAEADCIPLTPVTVRFSSPVPWVHASRVVLAGPNGQRWHPDPPESPSTSVGQVTFRGPFPARGEFRIVVPADLRDDAGRVPVNAAEFPLSVKTTDVPPLAKFASRFGILESHAQPALPVTVRRLEPAMQVQMQTVAPDAAAAVSGQLLRVPTERAGDILNWLRRVGAATRTSSVFAAVPAGGAPPRRLTLPKPHGADAFEVVGIPFEAPGLYVVELASPRLGAALLGKDEPLYVPAAALVTNLSAHLKRGRSNSLVWVTTLDAAQPVPGARVSVHDCQGTLLWEGATDENGIARIDRLPDDDALPTCRAADADRPFDAIAYQDAAQTPALESLDHGLFVLAQKDDDFTFVHSEWDSGIEPWRFQLPPPHWGGSVVTHTILDRSLLRAGETVHMKHVLRRQTLAGLDLTAPADQPALATVRHVGSNQKYELPLDWAADGTAESAWSIPRDAKLGLYTVTLPGPERDVWREPSAEFRVEEFKVPLMRGSVALPGEALIGAREVPVDLTLQYFAGGPAAGVPVTLRAQLRPQALPAIADFEQFTFANGIVREGVTRRGFDVEEGGQAAAPPVHTRQELRLDRAGSARTVVRDIPADDALRALRAEMEFRDPNGVVQTVSTSATLWPASRIVGIHAEQWAESTREVRVQVAVVDTARRPVPNATVQVQLARRLLYSNRKRVVGGFYAYEHLEDVRRVGRFCTGVTDARGLLRCTALSPVDGNVILEARTVDDAGRGSSATAELWIADTADWRFAVADSDRIDLLPEKPRYEPGETARLQVRMPFRDATALITTEREGILDAFVTRLSGTDPVITVPVQPAFAPNMFVSALVVRRRVSDVQPTAMVDLGRPAFKLGIAELRVGWAPHALDVRVSTERQVYHVREAVPVTIAVRGRDGAPLPPGGEVAVAAVDEGLLELRPNPSWDLLEAMMQRRGYGVRTATAQMQVIGKRHFGLKALPHGGGGGGAATRELFDTLLLWRGRVALDANGDAAITVPLNDSLTSFRIVAVATAGVARFGTGATSVRSTKDLMVLPGLAPIVREGDRIRAEATVRNTTPQGLDVAVTAESDGLGAPLAAQRLHLSAGAAETVGWDVTVPAGVERLRYVIAARAGEDVGDRVEAQQRVLPAIPVRALQATIRRLDAAVAEPVQRPVDALPGRGGVDVTLAGTLIGALDGVKQWMADYPYICLEQRVSRAVALQDEELWRRVAAELPAYQDNDGLLKYFPSTPLGSDTLTAYVLAVTQAAGLALPDDVRQRMRDGLAAFVGGQLSRDSALPAADLSLRKLAALDALARIGAAEAGMTSSIAIEPNLWPTSAVRDWWSVLTRVSDVPDRERRLREAEAILRSRLNVQGTTMGFSTEQTDRLPWLMTDADTNAVRLLLDLVDTRRWTDDLPRVARGAVGRMRRGAWATTVSNAWGVLAMNAFAAAVEATPVTGTTSVAIGSAQRAVDWGTAPAPQRLGFAWPESAERLVAQHQGTGAPWITITTRAAVPLRRPLAAGYRLTRTVEPVETRERGRLSRGDALRVRLSVEADSDMPWVVLTDPLPAGASHLGTGMGRESEILAAGDGAAAHLRPAYEERPFDAYRAYYEFVPKGHFVAEYVIRLNQSGSFSLPPTRVEALYAPEMFGEAPNDPVEVQP